MIKPLNTTQLSSAKPRGGLQNISDLLPKLLKQYELQAQAKRQIEDDNRVRSGRRTGRSAAANQQGTFAWYQ